MKDAIALGLSIGLTISLLLGPVFFALIQINIQQGFRSGVSFSTGIFFSDCSIAFLLFFGLTNFTYSTFGSLISISGAFFFIIFGITTIYSKKNNLIARSKNNFDKLPYIVQVLKGFILNTAHPGVWIFWMSVIGIIGESTQIRKEYQGFTILSSLVTVYIIDILKSILAVSIRKTLTDGIMIFLNKVVGLVIIIIGVIMVYTFFNK